MITKDDVISYAIDRCMKELYSLAQPKVSWKSFINQNKMYSIQKELWDKTRDTNPNWIGKSLKECIGPAPYEFYYLPRNIFKEVCDSYVNAFEFDHQQNLLDIIQILKNYCKEPIIDKWIKGEDGFPGHRDYEHPDNLKIEIKKKLEESPIISVPPSNKEEYYTELSEKLQDKFFEFLDMAGNFYNWNRDLNTFSMNVYLGAGPNSNKEAVIDNWKKYRHKTIKINDSEYEYFN